MAAYKRLTQKEILALTPYDINKMPEAQLRRAISDMNSIITKRIKRIESKGLKEYSHAIVETETDPIVMKLKDLTWQMSGKTEIKALKEQLQQQKSFVTDKTSTVRGTKKYKKYVTSAVEGYDQLSKKQQTNFWKNFNRLIELHPEIKLPQAAYGSDKLLQMYQERRMRKKQSYKSIIKDMDRILTEGYEKMEAARTTTAGEFLSGSGNKFT